MIEGWQYYNHAAIPTCKSHIEPDISSIDNKTIWNNLGGGTPLLARWITDWDCGYETNWWYCIRDGAYSIDDLTPSSRKHIRQALKKNTVIRCQVNDSLIDDMYQIYCEAHLHYKTADNYLDKESFFNTVRAWKKADCFVSYDESGKMTAYIICNRREDYVETTAAKFGEEALKIQSSNAIYHTVLNYYLNEIGLKYVSGGSRSINHESGTQEYKERVFGYRKAYCHLHIAYNPKIKGIIKIIYPFRGVLKKFNNVKVIHQINAVLEMEQIVREDKHME